MSTQPPRRLGRGISSLISSDLTRSDAGPAAAIDAPLQGEQPAVLEARRSMAIVSLALDRIRCNPAQPRRVFAELELQSLAASLLERGTLQPIVVRPAEGGYELIAGERRWRAARLAGLAEIPAIIRT